MIWDGMGREKEERKGSVEGGRGKEQGAGIPVMLVVFFTCPIYGWLFYTNGLIQGTPNSPGPCGRRSLSHGFFSQSYKSFSLSA